ncbi:hypothetical protein J2X72_001167 [Phyllobacterium sp. 1468]|nr:hypothetical protein [Phyllobacterium sp. 1468]
MHAFECLYKAFRGHSVTLLQTMEISIERIFPLKA